MYHVVCHDCDLEAVYEHRIAASVLVDQHGDVFHDVEFAEVR